MQKICIIIIVKVDVSETVLPIIIFFFFYSFAHNVQPCRGGSRILNRHVHTWLDGREEKGLGNR